MLHVAVSNQWPTDESRLVRRDEAGVAGFFEDLPVLMFVLAGTLTVILSVMTVSGAMLSVERSKNLGALASRSADLLVNELLGKHPERVVTISAVCSTGMLRAIDDFLGAHGFQMSVVMVHPELKWLSVASEPQTRLPEHAFSASRLVNALTDDGLIGVLVVRVLVW